VLDWAARQAGATLDDVAHKVSAKSAEKIQAGVLTPAQAERFAELTRVPFGYLFAHTPPPTRESLLADFRTTTESAPLGQDFYAIYDDVVYKQEWYRDYLQSIEASPLPFVGKFRDSNAGNEEVANDVRTTLRLSLHELRTQPSADASYSLFAERAEAAGILVFKNGVVGNNTHRPLSVSEFRGFAIADDIAPAVFINGADAKSAWLFTLAHELAHLWIGDSAISDASPKSANHAEIRCNAIAAEILVPAAEFLARWESLTNTPDASRIQQLRRQLKVSALVVARRALDFDFISYDAYSQIYLQTRVADKASGSGGDFYATMGSRNGKRFSKTVAALAMAGELGLRHASRLLNTTPTNVANYHERNQAIPS